MIVYIFKDACGNFLVMDWNLDKVHTFWEGHKILQNLHLTFDWHYIGQIGEDLQNCVAFSEYINFNTKALKTKKAYMHNKNDDDR